MYIVFAFPVFAIEGFQQRINKNHRTGINDQKQPWKGVLHIEGKKALFCRTSTKICFWSN